MKGLLSTIGFGTIVGVTTCLFTSACLQVMAAQNYDVISLGAFNGTPALGLAISQNGQGACLASPASGPDHSFLFTHRALVDVGSLGGATDAYGINDNGDIVGQSFLANNLTGHAFIKTNDVTASIVDINPPGWADSYANAINNFGQVVGFGDLGPSGPAVAFLYSGGNTTQLDPTADYSYAEGINDEGEIVGEFTPPLGSSIVGFVWFPGGGGFQEVGALPGGSSSSVVAVNSSGYFAGYAFNAPMPCTDCARAILGFAQPGQRPVFSDLGLLSGLAEGESYATAINNKGQVVGYSSYVYPDNGGRHAFLFDGSEMIDLNDRISTNSGWTLEYAYGINDFGQIAGYGRLNGHLSGFMLNPRPLVTNVLSQADPRWANQLYDHTTNTIQAKGCALTSLCMALVYAGLTNLPPNFAATNDPGALNDFMNTHSGFAGSGVNWEPAVDAATQKKSRFQAARVNSLTNLAGASKYLNTVLSSNAAPVIVGVMRTNSSKVGHFVLVIGKVADDYLIADPGHSDHTNLAQYTGFETRGFVTPLPLPQSMQDNAISPADTLVLAAGSDLTFSANAPTGQQAGWDPVSGQAVEQIPGSSAFIDSVDDDVTGDVATESDRSVYVEQPSPGIYQVTIPGLSAAAFMLFAESFYSDSTPGVPLILQGETTPGSTITNLVPVGTTLQLSPLGGNQLRLRLGSDTGLSFVIETSPDLAHWTPSGPYTLTNGVWETTYPIIFNIPGLYFRAKSDP